MTGYRDRLVDEDALANHLRTELGPPSGGDGEPLAVDYHPEGHSNETLFVTWGDRELVLRRPPAGETASTAHDVLREYRVMDALQGSDVPLPDTVLACDDEGVVGSEFYLMERLDGEVIREREPARFASPDARGTIGGALVDTLATIHTLDYDAVGLGDLGRPDGFLERQVDRWTRQFEWASEVTADRRPVPAMWEVADWLAANVPDPTRPTLVHGDYKLDNVMFGPGTPPELVGVFDWEMSTLGDPRTDLGWLLCFWPDTAGELIDDEFLPAFLTRDGYPTRQELVERWETATGLGFDDERFFRAFGSFKITAAVEMFFRRYLEGNSDDPSYADSEERVPRLAARTLRIVEGDEEL